MKQIDANRIKSDLSYNPETGSFIWNYRNPESFDSYRGYKIFNGKYAGKAAGSVKKEKDGSVYVVIRLNGELFRAHRLAWAYVHGDAPGAIDHINGDTLDNRIQNLRDGTGSTNARNAAMSKANTSGFNGVVWLKQKLRWRAQATEIVDGKRKNIVIGTFKELAEAVAARTRWDEANGYTGRHGKTKRCHSSLST